MAEGRRQDTECLTEEFHKMRFDGIQVLRGLAAVMVVLEHVRFLACGAFGVDIFFCISGFMMMYTTHGSAKGFLKKRVRKIVPLYWFMTVLTFFLILFFPSMFEQTKASLPFLVKSLLFLPFDIGDGVIQPLMRIGWTLNCEVFFYLLFALSLRISRRYRGLICSVLLLLPVAAGALFSNFKTLSGESPVPPVSFLTAALFFYGNPVMLEFLFGIAVYYAVRFLWVKTDGGAKLSGKRMGIPVLILSLALFAWMIFCAKHFSLSGYRRLLYWGIPSALTTAGFLICGFSLPMPRPGIYLGDISFSLYLVHYYPIMLLDREIFDFSTLTPRSALGAAAGLAAVIAAAALVSRTMRAIFPQKGPQSG